MPVTYEWRGDFTNHEVNALHAEAFDTPMFDESEWNWVQLVQRHSLGWVVARDGADLVGFVNVLWDGLVHAWLQDTMVAVTARGRGIGTALVDLARHGAKAAGCEYLHVDFDDHLAAFYYGACGFRPTSAGLLELN
jgi:ribosomal protein S18 acetylase RimI-like enzyme